jgi:hypothetical protein
MRVHERQRHTHTHKGNELTQANAHLSLEPWYSRTCKDCWAVSLHRLDVRMGSATSGTGGVAGKLLAYLYRSARG